MNKTHKKPKITLLEGKRNLDKLSSRRQPLYSLWSEYGDDTDFSASPLNKGKAGQVVELLIGLQNSSDSVDFLDGELKTSGMKERNGVIVPDQTVAVAQIGTRIDDLLFNPQFEKSFLYEKIKSLLLVPIVQPDKKDRSGWYLAPAIHIDIIKDKELLTPLEEDFHLICEKMMKSIKLDGRIHTTNAH